MPAEGVLAGITDGCALLDPALRFTYANAPAGALFGIAPEALVGRSLREPLSSPVAAALREPAERAVVSRAARRFDVHDEPADRWVEVCLYPSADGILVLLVDVTEVRRADVELAESLDYLQRLVDQFPAFLWIIDRELYVRRIEGGRPMLAALDRDRLIGLPMEEVTRMGVTTARDLALSMDMHRRALHGTAGHYRATWKDIVLESRIQPLRGPHGEIVGVIGVGVDVTEQTRVESRLQASEERFRALVEHDEALIGILDERARLVYATPSYTRVLGYTWDELRAMPDVWPLVHPDDVAYAQEQFAEVERREGVTLPRPVRCVTKDGRTRSFAITLTDLRQNAAVRGVVVNARDVTDEMLLEAQLRRAQRMEALGLLAGSVAHDFNNLLSAILGGAELARQAVPDATPLAADLDEIREAGRRAAALTRQLLAFSRGQVRRPHVLDLRAAARRAEGLLQRLLPDDVGLDVVLAPVPCVVRADAGQLEQVMMNLVVNAGDAIAAARTAGIPNDEAEAEVVTLEIARRTLDPATPAAPAAFRGGTTLPPGTYAALVVRDPGVGMDADALPHLFEPFFTTKAEGRGTGLGLATVFSIVTQSGGAVEVETAPGAGAAFTVLLPLVDAPPDAVEVAAAPAPGGHETILVVEDEGIVREMATRILTRHGYRVIAVRHGADAVLAWRERAGAIDGVVTDLRMPAMGGRALVEWLRAQQPSLSVVLMSGYASATDAAEAALIGREVFLGKPFTAESLLVCVRAALDRAAR
ncbi:MAG: PAS domain-containing protein [Gemmatirosa sp.]|nr:PAS domain-containing protein [Gemmatirosa sp.]